MGRERRIDRRRFLGRAAGGLGTLLVAGCDRLFQTAWTSRVLDSAERLDELAQTAITPRGTKGRLYTEADLSPHFKSNGTHDPADPEYQNLARNGFVDWRLELGGLSTTRCASRSRRCGHCPQ